MTPKDLARVEIEARRMRAEVLSQWLRGFLNRSSRASGASARAA